MAKQYYEFDTEENKITANVTDKVKSKMDEAGGIFAKVDKWKIFKQAVGMIASGCASVVVSKYLKANIPESSTAFEKGVMGVGMYMITGVVGSKVAKYAEQELDEWRDSVMMVKEAAKAEDPEEE